MSTSSLSSSLPIAVEVSFPERSAKVGVWYPLTVTIRNPIDTSTSVHLTGISCSQPGVKIDRSLTQQSTGAVEIRPCERYRFQLPVQATTLKPINLEEIRLQFKEDGHNLYPLRSAKVTVLPSFLNEVDIQIEVLERDENEFRALISLQHHGSTIFQNVGIGVEGVCPWN